METSHLTPDRIARVGAIAIAAIGFAFALPSAAQTPNAGALPTAGGRPSPGMAGGLAGAQTPAPAVTYTPGRMIPMTPDSKRPLLLKANERNPYARRSPGQETINEGGDNEEEIEIRSRLSSLSVTGRSRGPRGLRVLLGDIILEEGRILPPLIPDQTENLKVDEVSEDNVVFSWLDIETGEPTGKTMLMTYDLTPAVSYALHGQKNGGESEGDVDLQMGLMRIGKERERERKRMAEQDPAKKLPPEVYQAGQ